MGAYDWLWGALAGAAAGFGTAELRERLRHRRAVDGAALDLAREALDDIIEAADEIDRAWAGALSGRMLGSPRVIESAGKVVTAELRDRVGRALGHIDTRVKDAPLRECMLSVHVQIGLARDAARQYDAIPRRERRDDPFAAMLDPPFAATGKYAWSARESALAALERIAELERDRPRR